MKLVFVHDGTLKYDSNGAYYGTAVTPNSLSRYKYLSDDISVVIRTYPFKPDESKDRYMKIPGEYTIVHMDNYMSIRGIIKLGDVKKKLYSIVSDADLVVCRFSGETGKIAAQICRKLRKPYIVECVGCAWDSYWNYSLIGKIIAPYQFFHQQRLIKNAPYVIYVTERFLQKRYPTKGKWIAASNVELLPMDELVLSRRLSKISEDGNLKQLVIGTAAAIDVRYKGQAYVLKAMSILKKEGYCIKYQVIGAGESGYLNDIARKYNVIDDFEVLGTIPHEKVFNWIDNLDIYIQPSDQEGLPRALIEAMSRGCPAIGSSTAGIPELLDCNAIFERKKVSDLVCTIKRMADTKALIEQAKRNYKKALEYQRETIYNRRNLFFDMVIQETGLNAE